MFKISHLKPKFLEVLTLSSIFCYYLPIIQKTKTNPFGKFRVDTEQDRRINNQITAEQLMIIDEGGQSLGIMSKSEALQKAQEKGLDLIEIAASAKPPVARIMSFDKYRYQQEKKIKKQKAGQKNLELKQVQIGARSAINDLQVKASQVKKFLSEGRPVSIILVLRGREKANKGWAEIKLKEFLTNMIDSHRIISPIKFTGRGLHVQITRDK